MGSGSVRRALLCVAGGLCLGLATELMARTFHPGMAAVALTAGILLVVESDRGRS